MTASGPRATILGIRSEYDDAIIEGRKQAVRDVWAYLPVEHIPIMLSVTGNPWEYSVKDHSIRDFAAFREPFARRGIIYTGFTGTPVEAAAKYRGVMDTLAPDVIVIPQLSIGKEDDAPAYYAAMVDVSKEYSEGMWGR